MRVVAPFYLSLSLLVLFHRISVYEIRNKHKNSLFISLSLRHTLEEKWSDAHR